MITDSKVLLEYIILIFKKPYQIMLPIYILLKKLLHLVFISDCFILQVPYKKSVRMRRQGPVPYYEHPGTESYYQGLSYRLVGKLFKKMYNY